MISYQLSVGVLSEQYVGDSNSAVFSLITDYCLLDGYAVPLATLKKTPHFPIATNHGKILDIASNLP
ncbi:MAG: hypothetical protein RLZZ143_3410 [Cyanobacteriota bacterium]